MTVIRLDYFDPYGRLNHTKVIRLLDSIIVHSNIIQMLSYNNIVIKIVHFVQVDDVVTLLLYCAVCLSLIWLNWPETFPREGRARSCIRVAANWQYNEVTWQNTTIHEMTDNDTDLLIATRDYSSWHGTTDNEMEWLMNWFVCSCAQMSPHNTPTGKKKKMKMKIRT